MDIRELISLDDIMEELRLGPNGGLMYCMEHLEENLDDRLTEELENYLEDDYIVFDCPVHDNMVNFLPQDFRKESSIRYILGQIDNCIQYCDDVDVKIREFEPDEE